MLHFPSPDIGMFGRRQRHARGHRIPVTITRIGTPRRHDTAVVTDTLGPHDVVLPGGCRCCTIRMELQNALRRLLAGRAHRPFSRVIIETGEDLGPVLRTFATTRALGAEFYVEEHPAFESVHGRSSFVLTEGAPLSWDAFSRFITTLMALRGSDLLRAKGRLNVTGCRGPVVVEFLQHLALPPVELQEWDSDRTSRLEFVTRDIEEPAVRAMFDAVGTLVTSS